MEVRIHPHRTKVVAGVEKCVSITPKNGRAYYKAEVVLNNAHFVVHKGGMERARREQRRNVHAWCVGELAYESGTIGAPPNERWKKVTYHYNIGRFITVDDCVDVTDDKFTAAMCIGRDFYVLVD
jgi:hypothetical protein